MVEVATEGAGWEVDAGVMARDCEAKGKVVLCPCRDPVCKDGNDEREAKGKLLFRGFSNCTVGLTTEEKVEVKGEDEDEFCVDVDELRVECKDVDSGLRPRRGAGSPQTDGCPLTGRRPVP